MASAALALAGTLIVAASAESSVQSVDMDQLDDGSVFAMAELSGEPTVACGGSSDFLCTTSEMSAKLKERPAGEDESEPMTSEMLILLMEETDVMMELTSAEVMSDAGMFDFLSDPDVSLSAVPLPGALPLLIGGLAALGLLRRRRV